jgi:hypothetical protein
MTKRSLQTHILDFSLLPNLDIGSMFGGLRDELTKPIKSLHRALSRLETAEHAACKSTQNVEDRTLDQRAAYMRWASVDLVSASELLPLDLGELKLKRPPHTLSRSKSPLIHLVKEFRNLEVHLRPSKLSQSAINVLWGDPDPAKAHAEFDMQIWLVTDFDVKAFKQLKNATRYESRDLVKMIDWFNDAQRRWGAGDLIKRAIQTYCKELKDAYFPT